jgi:hypothetical protein
MNIKNLLGINVPPSPVNSAAKSERPIKMDNTQDRDANGQQLYQKEKRKEKMSDEQFEKAIAVLREKDFIKEMKWVVLAAVENDIKIAWVRDTGGNTIRKIQEWDLWELFDEHKSNETKGYLLNKTA